MGVIPAHSHLEPRLRVGHGQGRLRSFEQDIKPHAVLVMTGHQAQGLSLLCYCARMGVVDCLHPMISPGDFMFVRMVGGKRWSTGEQHSAVRICPAVPPHEDRITGARGDCWRGCNFLLSERYGRLFAGKVHLEDHNGVCEGSELCWVELGELEVVQGQGGTS